LNPLQVFQAFFSEASSQAAIIVREIRLPRALLGILVGSSLGLAGASLQGLLKNPLAEPGILGVTGGAVLGAVVTFYFGWSTVFFLALPLGGMSGALLAVVILFLMAGRSASVQTLVLSGVAVNTFAFAVTSLALNLSRSPYATLEIIFWQLGSIADRSMDHVFLILPLVLAGWVLLAVNGRALNALSLGEEAAQSLGISLKTLRLRVLWGTALCVGAATAVSGSIGFVGLVIPHLLRPWVGYEPGRLLGPSALGGAAMLLAADIAVRLVPGATELKLGVLTALVGAPFFLALILALRRRVA
jgi:iron complex transport system permease protein